MLVAPVPRDMQALGRVMKSFRSCRALVDEALSWDEKPTNNGGIALYDDPRSSAAVKARTGSTTSTPSAHASLRVQEPPV